MPLPPPIALSWSQVPGGESCITRAQVAARVDATLGRDAFTASADAPPQASIHGAIGPAPAPHGWLAVIEARRADSTFQRRLVVDASDCRQLDESIVVVIALMIDSSETDPPPLAIPAAPARSSIAVGFDVVVAGGMLPGVGVGLGLASEVRVPPLWPIAVWTDAWPTSSALQDGTGGRLGAWTLGAALCPLTFDRTAWALYGCAGATGGAVYSNGVQLDVSQSHTRPYLQAEVRAGLRVRIGGPLYGVVEAGAGIPFSRDSYTYTRADGTVDDVFQTAVVVPMAHLRVEVRVR